MNQQLGDTAREEIRTAMQGLVGAAAKQETERLAAIYPVTAKYIYRMTQDLRKGNRKKRSDAGKRTYELVPGTDVWYAAQLVIVDKLDPDLALLTANVRGYTQIPSLEYFRKLLAENGLGRKALRNPKEAFRPWEAEFPGEIFQIDVTALKVRWQDEKSRRVLQIEGVDKNHPQMDPTKIRVWQIMLVDDHSRRRFHRYITARAITSTEMVRFMCEAYDVLGVPINVYTDQGGEFKGRHRHAAKILNAIPTIKETGGYNHIPHAAGNAKATGKVENAHQWALKMDKLVGVAIREGQIVDLKMLNILSDRYCEFYNNIRVHRTTGEIPMFRWNNKRVMLRKLDRSVVEAALLSEEFDAVLDPSMTVTRDSATYRIPGVQPFVDYVGKKVRVVVPPNIDLILMTLPGTNGKFEPENGGEYEIEKILATADKAGEFKSVAESTPQILKKQLKATRKVDADGIKLKNKQTGEIAPVPYLNVDIEHPATNIAAFRQPVRLITAEEIGQVAPIPRNAGILPAAPSTPHTAPRTAQYEGRVMTYWEAVAEYQTRFDGGIVEAKEFLQTLFPETKGTALSGQIEAAIAARFETEQPRRLQAVGT